MNNHKREIQIVCVFLLIVAVSGLSQQQGFQWATQSTSNGSTNYANGTSIAQDASGNTYILGSFYYNVHFGSISLVTGSTDYSLFIAKYNSSGALQWAAKYGDDNNEEEPGGIAVDASGNCFVTGYFKKSTTLGGILLTNNDQIQATSDIFIFKINPSGGVLWAKKAGGTYDDYGYAIATDGSGNAIITGSYNGNATFDGASLLNSGMFIAKYNSSGTLQFAKRAASASDIKGKSIATDNLGQIFITGEYYNTPTFYTNGSTIILPSASSTHWTFTARFDALGYAVWAKYADGWNNQANGIVVDGLRNVVAVGTYSVSKTFGTITINSNGGTDGFVVKYDVSGNELWAQTIGGTTDGDEAHGAATDGIGNIIVTGLFYGTSTFGIGTSAKSLTSSGDADIFVAKYDASGNITSTVKAGGSHFDIGVAIVTDASGNNIITGSFLSSTATFGSTTLTLGGGGDAFLAKLNTAIKVSYNSWNLASIPDGVPDLHQSAVYPSSVVGYGIYVYQTSPAGYVLASNPLANNQGYWARFGTPQDIIYSGNPTYSMSMPVNAGWNIIGSISVPIPTSSVVPSVGVSIKSDFWKYDHGYRRTQVLNPGEGYWVKVDQAGELLLDPTSLPPQQFAKECAPPPDAPLGSAPSPPALSSPANGATGEPLSLTITWQAAAYATSYQLQVSASSGFDVSVFNQSNISGTSVSINTPAYSTRYYWRVNAQNDVGTSDWSCVWNFVTSNPPDPCGPGGENPNSMDQIVITDSKGNSQDLYVYNSGRPFNLHGRDFDLPPETPDGMFYVSFQSGNMVQGIPPSHSHTILPIKVKDVNYPLTISWRSRPENNITYSLLKESVDKQASVSLSGSGSQVLSLPNGGSIFIVAQAIDPPPCDWQPDDPLSNGMSGQNSTGSIPGTYSLNECYPNPFNPTTKIDYALPQDAYVSLRVFNVLGQEVGRLVDEYQTAGYKSVEFDASRLPSGIYFYRLNAGNFVDIKKMIFVK